MAGLKYSGNTPVGVLSYPRLLQCSFVFSIKISGFSGHSAVPRIMKIEKDRHWEIRFSLPNLLVALLLAAHLPAAHAQGSYTSRADGSWTDPTIWSANPVNTTPTAGAYVTVHNAVSGAPSGLSLNSLNVEQGGSLSAPNLFALACTWTYPATFSGTLSDSVSFWINYAATNNGTLNILSGGGLNLSLGGGNAGFLYGSGSLYNWGTMFIQGQGTFNVGCGFYNCGGTINVSNNQVLAIGAGTGSSSNTTLIVASGGLVDLAALGGSSAWTALLGGSGGGTVLLRTNQINGNNVQLNFPAGMFWFTGGVLNGRNGEAITNTGFVNVLAAAVPSNAPEFFQTFYNDGSVIQTNNGTVVINSTSWPIENRAAGKYLFQSDGALTNGELDNWGTLEKIGGTGTTTIASVFNNYGGTIKVDSGTLSLPGGNYLQDCLFSVASGANCDLTGGNSPTGYGSMTGSGGGTVQLSSGAVRSSTGNFTFNFPPGLFWWTGGGIGGSYAFTNAGTVEIQATNAPILSAPLCNLGLMRYWGTNPVNIASSLKSLAGSTNDFTSDASLTGSGTFDNWGTLRKSGGSGTTTIGTYFLNHGGLIDVESGRLAFANPGISSNGTIYVASNTVCDLTGGSSGPTWSGTLAGSGTGQVQVNSGKLSCGVGNLTLNFPPGMFWWSGGILTGNYNYTNVNQINIQPTTGQELRENFYNQGLIQFYGTNSLAVVWPLENLANGTNDFLGDAGIGNTLSGPSYMDNWGLLRKSGGTGTTAIYDAFNNLGGTLQVLSGKILLGGGGTSSNGTFLVSPGAVCDLSGSSSPTWSGLLTGSGGGQVLINSGGLLPGSTGVTFNFPSNMLQWIGGTLGSPYTGSLTNLGTFNIQTTSNTACSAKFYNAGLVRISGTTNLDINSSGSLENLAGATNEITSDANIISGTIDNWGVLRKSGGTGVSTISSIISQNGLVAVDSGTLVLSSTAARANGNYAVAAGASLDLTGGSIVPWFGTLAATGAGRVYLASGQIYGNNLKLNFPAGTFWFTGGILNGNTGNSITNTGVINVAPSNAPAFYQLLYNDGLIAQTSNGTVTITISSYPLENRAAGTYDFQSDGVLTGGQMDNWGLVRKSSGTGNSVISSTFVNHGGSFRVDSGALVFTNQSLSLSNSSLTISLSGTSAGQWGKLVGGTVSLGGPLNVLLAQPLTVAAGAQLRFLSCTSRTGVFSTTTVPAGFTVSYDAAGAYLLATNNVAPTAPRLLLPTVQAGKFNFAFQSYGGVNYSVQHNDDLATTNWLTDTNISGDGSLVPVSLPAGSQPARFYRLEQN